MDEIQREKIMDRLDRLADQEKNNEYALEGALNTGDSEAAKDYLKRAEDIADRIHSLTAMIAD